MTQSTHYSGYQKKTNRAELALASTQSIWNHVCEAQLPPDADSTDELSSPESSDPFGSFPAGSRQTGATGLAGLKTNPKKKP